MKLLESATAARLKQHFFPKSISCKMMCTTTMSVAIKFPSVFYMQILLLMTCFEMFICEGFKTLIFQCCERLTKFKVLY